MQYRIHNPNRVDTSDGCGLVDDFGAHAWRTDISHVSSSCDSEWIRGSLAILDTRALWTRLRNSVALYSCSASLNVGATIGYISGKRTLIGGTHGNFVSSRQHINLMIPVLSFEWTDWSRDSLNFWSSRAISPCRTCETWIGVDALMSLASKPVAIVDGLSEDSFRFLLDCGRFLEKKYTRSIAITYIKSYACTQLTWDPVRRVLPYKVWTYAASSDCPSDCVCTI